MRLPRRHSSPSFFHPSTNRRIYRFASSGESTPLTQKVISGRGATFGAPRARRHAVRRRRRGNRDAMPDNDGVVADQDLLDDEAHDVLPFDDVKRISSAA